VAKLKDSYYSFFSLSVTLSDDGAHRVCDFDIPFYEMNAHCLTNDLYYGTGEVTEAPVGVGEGFSFRNGNLRDVFIKNRVAGLNGKLVIVATVPTDVIRNKLGL